MLYSGGNEPGRVNREEYEAALSAIEDDAAEVAEIEAMRNEDQELPENVHKRLLQLESRLEENRNIVAVYKEGH